MTRAGGQRRGRHFPRILAALAALAAAAVPSGCTSFLSDLPVVGEPANVPPRPEDPGAFPAVHDMPPPRDTKPLTEDERRKLEAELQKVRDEQAAKVAPPPPPAPAPPPVAAKKSPDKKPPAKDQGDRQDPPTARNP